MGRRPCEAPWIGTMTRSSRLQMNQFLSEWEMLMPITSTPDETALVEKVKDLALRCQSGTHLYLALIGDWLLFGDLPESRAELDE